MSILDAVGVLGGRGQSEGSVAVTAGLWVWCLWYLCSGGGARVLDVSYGDVLAEHPEPPPRIALWAKIVAGPVVLLAIALAIRDRL